MTQTQALPTQSRQAAIPAGWVVGAIIVGTLVRLAIAWVSYGTNDMSTWGFIGNQVRWNGLLETYRTQTRQMNHPPIPVLWAALTTMAGSAWLAGLLMKIPAIVGDGLSCVLLAMIFTRRGDLRLAKLASLAMALSPIAILISGYHCNTDNLYAALGLLAVYLAADRRRFFFAGLALGAAINVKLIPVLLIPVLFALCRNRDHIIYLVIGLAIAAVPFLPLLTILDAVRQNMVQYTPPESDWGIIYILHDLMRNPNLQPYAARFLEQYKLLGRLAIIAGVLTVCGASRLFKRCSLSGYELAALIYSIFLILAPGFGPQYLVIIVPFMLTICLRRAWIYGSIAGVFVLLNYIGTLVREWPADPVVRDGFPLLSVFGFQDKTIPGAPIGLLAWFVLIELVAYLLIQAWNRNRAVAKTD